MNIIARLNPLYQDLTEMGLPIFMSKPHFNRLTNKLNLTEEYTIAYNEANKKENVQFDWLGTPIRSYEDVLASFLNVLFQRSNESFCSKLVDLVCECLPFLGYYPDIDDLLADLESVSATDQSLSKLKESWRKIDLDYYRKVMYFFNLVMTKAINQGGNTKHYLVLRQDILKHNNLKAYVPKFIVDNVSMEQFWEFIKTQGGYRSREAFVSNEFQKLLEVSKTLSEGPEVQVVENENIDQDYINDVWRKAIVRLNSDPEAAITSARTLIETVCKYILGECSVSFDDSIELPKLYKLTAIQLNLSPDGHTEQIFKQILSGCSTVVDALGSLRNKHSDAHGSLKKQIKPSARHAQLAVHLAGAMSGFLLQTFENITRK